MFKFLIIFCSFIFSGAHLTDNNELRRQYDNFLQIFKKQETSSSFQTFVQNLNTIENYNKYSSECRMYLTQHSDTFEDVYILKKCK
jgi:hypothetical protein